MKVTLFNDTHKDWTLHIGSLRGVGGESRIPARQSIDFGLAAGCDVFIKLWETGVVLVQPCGHNPSQHELPFGD